MHTDIYSDELFSSANPVDVYEINTLVDITDTQVITPKKSSIKFYQAQNLNTFLQVIGLRSQVLEYKVKKSRADYQDYGFNGIQGDGNVWSLRFTADSTSPWLKNDDKLYWLRQDFFNIPIHTKLNETIKLKPEMVITDETGKINTCFNIVQNI